MKLYDKLLYWIEEREEIRLKKEAGLPKPWSQDKTFQYVYFCNVRRENDKVTRWIREQYSDFVDDEMFEWNIILARFINWPPTLGQVGFIREYEPKDLNRELHALAEQGKVWGNAYTVTTHGMIMDKIDYLTSRVMLQADSWQGMRVQWNTCKETAKSMINSIEGISTFMAGQVVADLKNTPGHRLEEAADWWNFALPGPGSRRGMDWLLGEHVTDRVWHEHLLELQIKLQLEGWSLCAQDIQNCLCEFDKYMRVSTGQGRSKRTYNGN